MLKISSFFGVFLELKRGPKSCTFLADFSSNVAHFSGKFYFTTWAKNFGFLEK